MKYDLKFFAERFMAGNRKLEWVLIQPTGCLPRPAILVSGAEMLIDINRKAVLPVDEHGLEILKVDYLEVENGFELHTAEETQNYCKGVIFPYNYDELAYIYKADNIKTAEHGLKLRDQDPPVPPGDNVFAL